MFQVFRRRSCGAHRLEMHVFCLYIIYTLIFRAQQEACTTYLLSANGAHQGWHFAALRCACLMPQNVVPRAVRLFHGQMLSASNATKTVYFFCWLGKFIGRDYLVP